MAASNQRISEYLLDAKLGAGTFGEVWRARHHVWADQFVAIKIPTDSAYVRNLQHEGSAIHGLKHPNIVRAIGFDPYADPPYLITEYVPGTSLRPLIQSRALKVSQAVSIIRQILAGLSHAHAAGIVHRDLKPENILIHERAEAEGYDAEGVVKVTDFGLGLAMMKTAVGSIAYSASLNDDAGRQLAGTLDYMSPEQRAGGTIDLRVDLYACGVILYEMLTGEKPAGTDVPSDLNKAVPRWLDEAFRHSYARLENRFISAEQFVAALTASSIGAADSPRIGACPSCKHSIDPADQFCMHCGVQLVARVRRCPQCGAYPDGSDSFCMFCGSALNQLAGVG